MRKSTSELTAVAHQHADAEAKGDLDMILATLEGEPVYDLYPLGRRFSGMEKTRRYYEYFVAEVQKRIAGYALHGEWIGDAGVAQEYTVALKHPDGSQSSHRIFAILTFGQEKLSGERIYSDDVMLKALVGPLWDELTPIAD